MNEGEVMAKDTGPGGGGTTTRESIEAQSFVPFYASHHLLS